MKPASKQFAEPTWIRCRSGSDDLFFPAFSNRVISHWATIFLPAGQGMTIETVNLSSLKTIKNNVIGNPSAKLALAQDQDFIQL